MHQSHYFLQLQHGTEITVMTQGPCAEVPRQSESKPPNILNRRARV
jgi:hypothetical protein